MRTIKTEYEMKVMLCGLMSTADAASRVRDPRVLAGVKIMSGMLAWILGAKDFELDKTLELHKAIYLDDEKTTAEANDLVTGYEQHKAEYDNANQYRTKALVEALDTLKKMLVASGA